MKRLFLLTCLLVNCLATHAKSSDHVVVITRQDSSINTISKSQLRNLFMGNLALPDVTPIALSPGEVARSIFNIRVIGLTESRIQAYWAQMRFSGRQQRPETADSIDELILMIESSKDTIGYLPEGTPLPEDIKIIYRSSAQ
tara:strand:+ start:18277 stop:18702 length:426 start_codon:yes stop_codon:yes gene_type:complete